MLTNNVNYLIIDDEPIAHRILENYCSELPFLKKIGNAYNALEASEIINKHHVDLIFLDLQMPKIMGFDFLKSLSNPPKVIVTTAYKEHALEGYELNIVDYLLKPFSLSRFLKAINKISYQEKNNTPITNTIQNADNKSLFLKGDKMYHQVKIENILFIEAYGNYVKIFFDEEMLVIHEKISNLEIILSNENILRVHKSFLISTKKITIIEGNLIHINNYKIPIGQTYRSKINDLINKK